MKINIPDKYLERISEFLGVCRTCGGEVDGGGYLRFPNDKACDCQGPQVVKDFT